MCNSSATSSHSCASNSGNMPQQLQQLQGTHVQRQQLQGNGSSFLQPSPVEVWARGSRR